MFPTPAHTHVLSCITWLAYPSSYNLTGFIILTSSYSSHRSYLSNWHIYITKSIILSPSFLVLSVKILPISKLSIRNIVSFNLIYCHPFLIPFIRSFAFTRYITLIALIPSIGEIIPSYSCYIKKGLVYINVAALSNYQPLSCVKYIKVNICLSYNVCSVSNAKYIYYPTLLNCLILYLSYYKVLNPIHC